MRSCILCKHDALGPHQELNEVIIKTALKHDMHTVQDN